MGTWLGVIVETRGGTDFWGLAREHNVVSIEEGVAAYALIDCPPATSFDTPTRLAEALSRDLQTTAIGFLAQTNADVHELTVFRNGQCVRRLDYSRDEGGWVRVEGEQQPFECAYFFDGNSAATKDGDWPDTLDDDLSDADVARYEAARRAGDPSRIMDLLHPSSLWPLVRLTEHFGVARDAPVGRYDAPSWWKRLFSGA